MRKEVEEFSKLDHCTFIPETLVTSKAPELLFGEMTVASQQPLLRCTLVTQFVEVEEFSKLDHCTFIPETLVTSKAPELLFGEMTVASQQPLLRSKMTKYITIQPKEL
ncbi:hypothetical protein Glove_195g13 [Diversispora epigaea]|uniref:Uncharacterized protein n=1 Tax=Diversispora epigaea TaxID=1348612 RepID=A0A397IP92_9GLOM|nr:hypothetical protein Glove_195g13 [Diversispora epigaea]